MTWVLILVGGWLLVAVVAALLVGRTVHTADVIEHTEAPVDRAPESPEQTSPPAADVRVPRAREPDTERREKR